MMEYCQTHSRGFSKKIIAEWNENLKNYLKKNLRELGFEFDSDFSFYDFCKRINRVSFIDKPNYYEFYLDYIDKENNGVFIGSYSDKIEIKHEGNKITAIIG
jgi:hypothetical protein